jgi:hypothetical protein
MISFSACGQDTSNTDKQLSELKFDTTTIAILELKKPLSWLFDSTYKPTILAQNYLSIIENFVIKAVNDFNSWQKKNNSGHPWIIDLKNRSYRKQLITVTNKKGEKEVWVNCFCSPDSDWKSKLIIVEDGATCFFNFKINLSTKTYYDFRVNPAG